MKQFAYLLLGEIYATGQQAEFTAGNTRHRICTARNFEEAKALVTTLAEEGVGAIELCGAFGQKRARELMALTQEKVSISYAVHEPEMDAVHAAFFR